MLADAIRPAPARLLGTLSVYTLLGMLVAGLWPFHQPHNEVTWVENGDGLSLGDHGTLLSPSAFDLNDSVVQAPCSLEIWLQPNDINDSGTLLAFLHLGQSPGVLATAV